MHPRHIQNKIRKHVRELNEDMERVWDQTGMIDCFMTFAEKIKNLTDQIESEENGKTSSGQI